jgi:hypothetical protein
MGLFRLQLHEGCFLDLQSCRRCIETILIEVGVDLAGMKSLFAFQCVNTTFNNTINSSPKLRRIMFKQGTDTEDDIEPILNPLLLGKSTNRTLYPAVVDVKFGS